MNKKRYISNSITNYAVTKRSGRLREAINTDFARGVVTAYYY